MLGLTRPGLGVRSVLPSLAIATLCLAAEANNPPASRPAEGRTLQFGARASVGSVWIRPSDYPGFADEFHGLLDNADWHRLGPARGRVAIPPGYDVRLHLTVASGAALARLSPGDVQVLNIVRGGEALLPAVSQLSGLRALEFPRWFESGPCPWSFSPRSLKLLAKCGSLESIQAPEGLADEGLIAIIEACPQLKTISFAGRNQVSDAGAAAIAKLRHLEALSIGGGRMTAEGLAPLAGLPNLRHLELWGSFDDAAIPHVRSIDSLDHLGLAHLHISDAGLRQLAGHRRLRVLDLFNTDVTVEGFDAFAELPALRNLNLGKWGGTLARARAGLPKLARLQQLEVLKLPEGLSDADFEWLGRMRGLRRLEVGSSDQAPLSDQALEHLVGLDHLEHLFIGGTGITDAGMASLARLARMRSLRLFAAPGVTNAGLTALSPLRHLETLEIRSVARAKLTTSGLNVLNAFPRLQVLEVHATRDGGEVDLSKLHHLVRVTLSGQLRDAEIASIKDAPRLEQLHLGRCPEATDAALIHIASHFRGLQRLSIEADRCTDRGLAEVARIPGLWSLRVSGDFTDQGLLAAGTASGLNTLDITPLHPFSPAALESLRISCPQLTLRQGPRPDGAGPTK